ncbi:hypothetical protein E6H37_01915 [Candidatus Bathyarchaeota archaeon]|nr:MAG: hypothetical protein E6H37_01915 [Candidatus Bathyarchaeota archaeon]
MGPSSSPHITHLASRRKAPAPVAAKDLMTKRGLHEPPVRLLQPNTTTKAPANSKSHPANPITLFPLITGWGSASTSCHLQRLGGSYRRRRVH